ncbi:calpain-A-like [Saccostrea echinata]|uniref:calpain-A-like n=1 Tax=Saccostrea echinata TaxID=191078 RepID=UPI002A828DAF|nr:calpain-A-like [Saccostrea echinata]XP_061193872.1 calpain-A-like [Saccostrea echinata]
MGCGGSKDDGALFVRVADPYTLNFLGVYESFWDFRETSDRFHGQIPPKCTQLWTDTNLPPPKDCQSFRAEIKGVHSMLLCRDPESPDLNQGELDTTYFLNVIEKLTPRTDIIKHLIPNDKTRVIYKKEEIYVGVVHCRVWRFGRWVDIYVDDSVPCVSNSGGIRLLSYCHDKDELWLTFLEKAWARFWGGYTSIEYGYIHDTYLSLTGGVYDAINLEKTRLKPGDIYYKIRRGIAQGAHVGCSVSRKHDGVYGLTAGDTFTIVETYQVHTQKGKEIHLLRMRDPLGYTLWKGPWNENGSEWASLPPESDIMQRAICDNEFIMAFRDFIAYMECVCVCSITPVVDQDINQFIRLKYCTHVFGEWYGVTAAGSKKILDNPKFCFTIPSRGFSKEQTPMVVGISLLQLCKDRLEDRIPITLRVFKARQQKQGMLIEEIGETFEQGFQQILRTFKLKPGKYMILPHTAKMKTERHFLLRIYTTFPLKYIQWVPSTEPLLLLKEDKPLNLKDLKCTLDCCEEIWGRWSEGLQGGFIYDRDFDLNPQVDISVPEGDELKQVIRFKVLKDWNSDDACLGFRLFRVGPEELIPKETQWLYDHWDHTVRCRDGSIEGWEWDYLAPTFLVEPGRYCGILYNEKPGGSNTAFCIMVYSAVPLQIKSYNLGK